MAKEKKSLGWKVDDDLIEKFKSYCEMTGSSYQDAIAAAMVIWQYLPASIQRQAQLEANGTICVDAEFWKLLNDGLNEAVAKQVYEINKK